MICAVLFSMQSAAQTITAKPNVYAVTVYMLGAELHCSAEASLPKGKSTVLLPGLSPQLNAGSIRFSIESGDATILSVSSRTNYLESKSDNKQIKTLKDSVEIINDQLTRIAMSRETFMKEKDLLFKNQSIGGTENGVKVEEIQRSADFFRLRSNQINDELFILAKNESKYRETLARLQSELAELNATYNPPSSEIELSVMNQREGKVKFDFSYMVNGCGWAPKYDIRADGIDKPIQMVYRANLFNNSGVDWIDAKIKLSTAEPGKSATRPTLDKWALNYGYDVQDASINNVMNYDQRMTIDAKKEEGSAIAGYETIRVDELSQEFEIALPYTILSDSKAYTVDVNSFDLPASFEYSAVPKMDRDAFLVARITDWNKLNLVSGHASVFYAGTFVGQSYINTSTVADTMSISLGRDKRIIIKRAQKMEDSKSQVIGNSIKETFMYEIVVRNNKESAVSITLQDQVPVSQNSDISVDVINISGGTLDPLSGIITWKMTLQPGETKQLILNYSIKYPKNQKVEKQRYRSMKNARFL
ncbi:hypothetical protein SDC9_62069 [bioreactor metagenome]|uniref:DUF4139 domain-containing protein n=1 Tax=bioreactor metagenome TaxID=1076179 RepID=A0A644XIT3_9ZZZZ